MLFVAHLRGELTLVHLREQLHQVPAASAPASSTS
jgi:hypothetical protein